MAPTVEQQSNPDSTAAAGPSRTPAILVALATILAIVSVLSIWARTQVLDTDAWVEVSSELLTVPEVQESLANHLVEVVFVDVDLAESLEERLPDALAPIATPVAAAIRAPITDGVVRLLASDRFQTLWVSVNRTTHETLVAVVHGESLGRFATSDGTVALDLKPLVTEVATSFGLSGDRIASLPDDVGRIVIFESEDLAAVQGAVAALEFSAWLVFVLVVALYAAAVYLAGERRFEVLRHVGWSVLLVGIAVLALRGIAIRMLVESLIENPANRTLADVVATVATSLLGQMGWSAIVFGALIVLFTSLVGPHRWAVAIRRILAPALDVSVWAVGGGAALLIFLFLWWNPGRAFSGWTASLVLVSLVLGGVLAVSRQVLQDSSAGDVDGRGSGPQPEQPAVHHDGQ